MRFGKVLGLLMCSAAMSLIGCTGEQTADGSDPAVQPEPGMEATAIAPEAPEASPPPSGAMKEGLSEDSAAGPDAMDAAQAEMPADGAPPAAAPVEAMPPLDEPSAQAVPPPVPNEMPRAITQSPAPAKRHGKVAAVPGGRVVRYVKADGATIHGAADPNAAPVGHLTKGDIVMVTETNGWGKIADNMFVRLGELSAKAVARPVRKEASWIAPKQ